MAIFPVLAQIVHIILPVEQILLFYRALTTSQDLPKPRTVRNTVLVIGIVAYIAYVISKALQHIQNTNAIAKRRKRSQRTKEKLVWYLEELASPNENEIRSLSFDQLYGRLQEGQLQPEVVISMFQRKALEVDRNINAITDILPLKVSDMIALTADGSATSTSPMDIRSPYVARLVERLNQMNRQWVDERDSVSFSTALSSRTMYGIPISLAEVIRIKDHDATAGMCSFIDVLASDDAVIVKLMKSAGGVPFTRTNVPQAAHFTFASSNPIYGSTVNPFNSWRSPGGASSGEAALLASGGSVLGLGVDFSGGIRIPAHFCGVCGLKPTSNRISNKGVMEVVEGQTDVAFCVGPLAKDVSGLVNFLRSVCVPLQSVLDPAVSLVPFDEMLYDSPHPLIIGFYIDDGKTASVPSVRRAILEAKNILKRQGHSLIPFEPPDMKEMLGAMYLPVIGGVLSEPLVGILVTDQVDPCLKNAYQLALIPYPLRWLYAWFISKKNPMVAAAMACYVPSQLTSWWQLRYKIKLLKHRFILRWKHKKLNALLCPVMPFPACQLGQESALGACITNTALFNLLDFPAGTVPVCNVTDEDLEALSDKEIYPCKTDLEKVIFQDQLGAEGQAESRPTGLPVGVQVAALPFQEEIVLKVMGEIEQNRTSFTLPPWLSTPREKTSPLLVRISKTLSNAIFGSPTLVNNNDNSVASPPSGASESGVVENEAEGSRSADTSSPPQLQVIDETEENHQ